MKYITAIFVLFIFGCKKNDTQYRPDTFINGQVINTITGEPVSNVTLKFVECENPYMYSPTCQSIGYATTDSLGNFSFSYENNSNFFHYCLLHENGFIHADTSYSIINQVELTNSSNQTITLKVLPYSRIWFEIENINCFNNNDLLEIFYTNEILNFEGFSYPWNLHGCTNYESQVWEQVPMGKQYFHYRITKNNNVQDIYHTLYLSPGKDTVLQILY